MNVPFAHPGVIAVPYPSRYMPFNMKIALALFAASAGFSSASIIDQAKFIFAFRLMRDYFYPNAVSTDLISYTAEGWNGQGDPLASHSLSCSTAGPNWARQFTNIVNHTQFINLAVSGATSDKDIVFASPPDFRSQTTSFLNFVVPFPEKVAWTKTNAIFTVSFGTNDVNNSYKNTAGNGTSLYSQDLDSYFSTVEKLYVAGARQFVFNNVVPFDRAQIGVSQGTTLQTKLRTSQNSILDFNSQLSTKAAAYCGSKTDIKCSVFDTHALFTNIMNNFRNFGFATPDGFCNSYASRGGCDVLPTVDSSCLGPVSVYVWKDSLHPAWAADTLWAQGLFNQLSSIN
ncbi:hypothetical protein BDZ94DRAFT_1315677 [Collybia nuda]|uniref:Carbohydrate esterase family 16 protein n=1 Tax=Collybia nuda TaxID=64659 RepID=A0A9P5XQY1_9AGAR|nr:hypothetical protein BDZ94DRAFT_1315677 [Collybia nuda]